MNLRQRLEALIENPRLKASGRDYTFVQSLHAYYVKNGRLTSGRRVWVDRLEERYGKDSPDNTDATLAARLDAVMERVKPDSWDFNFLSSVAEQNRQRGSLSPRQMEILEKIEERHSDEAISNRNAWQSLWDDEKAERMRVAAEYYSANPPYYGDLARRVLSEPDFIPTQRQYAAMTENKFAAKVLAAHFAEPVYPAGSKVSARSCAPREFRNKKGFVMKVNAKPVVTAARGTKIYMVLPIGEATPIFVEERHLKKGRF